MVGVSHLDNIYNIIMRPDEGGVGPAKEKEASLSRGLSLEDGIQDSR